MTSEGGLRGSAPQNVEHESSQQNIKSSWRAEVARSGASFLISAVTKQTHACISCPIFLFSFLII